MVERLIIWTESASLDGMAVVRLVTRKVVKRVEKCIVDLELTALGELWLDGQSIKRLIGWAGSRYVFRETARVWSAAAPLELGP